MELRAKKPNKKEDSEEIENQNPSLLKKKTKQSNKQKTLENGNLEESNSSIEVFYKI
jgi:hypothetical protein